MLLRIQTPLLLQFNAHLPPANHPPSAPKTKEHALPPVPFYPFPEPSRPPGMEGQGAQDLS